MAIVQLNDRARPGMEKLPIVAVYCLLHLSDEGMRLQDKSVVQKSDSNPFKPRQLLELVDRFCLHPTKQN